MSLTAVGSIAFDSVKTPFGERERMLGGSAVHFSLAASFFSEVHVVGPVGDDFGEGELAVLEDHGVATEDIERVEGGKTFFWRGHYDYDLNTAHTDDTQLNVFGDFEPKLSDASRAADILFLANIQPDLQRQVRAQCDARFAALDSMNMWIETARDSLLAAIAEVDCVIINDAEIRELTQEPNLARAARTVTGMGPRAVVAKQGEYGAALFTESGFFALPGYPLEDVCVIIGPPVDCQENFPQSDEKGLWLADLPVAGGLSWTFNFSKPGYELAIKKATSSAPGEQIINVVLQPK